MLSEILINITKEKERQFVIFFYYINNVRDILFVNTILIKKKLIITLIVNYL